MNDKTDIFLEYRSLLFSVAYNMLGSIANAEDIVQETYLKWMEIQSDHIKNVKAYLVKITTNKCINFLNSTKQKREEYVGFWLPELLPDHETGREQKRVESYHALSIGIMVLMEKLSPQERAIFILREVFAYDYKELAEIFDKTEDNCRQIYKRAKENLGKDSKRFAVDIQAHEKMLNNFMQACIYGDVDNLIELLKDDVILFADGGGTSITSNGIKLTAALSPVHGREPVSKFIVFNMRKLLDIPGFSWKVILANGLPSLVSYIDKKPISIISLEWDGSRLRNIFIQANPEKLKQVF